VREYLNWFVFIFFKDAHPIGFSLFAVSLPVNLGGGMLVLVRGDGTFDAVSLRW
jgi:hypothetical protein